MVMCLKIMFLILKKCLGLWIYKSNAKLLAGLLRYINKKKESMKLTMRNLRD